MRIKRIYTFTLVIAFAVIAGLIFVQIKPAGTSIQHEFLNPTFFTVTDTIDDTEFSSLLQDCEITLRSTQYPVVVEGVHFLLTEGTTKDRISSGEVLSFKSIKIVTTSGNPTVFVATDTTEAPTVVDIETGAGGGAKKSKDH